jgi:hypothetical protein
LTGYAIISKERKRCPGPKDAVCEWALVALLGVHIYTQGEKLWQKTYQALKAFALRDAIFLQKTVGRRKMGLGIVNPVPVIVKKAATAIK